MREAYHRRSLLVVELRALRAHELQEAGHTGSVVVMVA